MMLQRRPIVTTTTTTKMWRRGNLLHGLTYPQPQRIMAMYRHVGVGQCHTITTTTTAMASTGTSNTTTGSTHFTTATTTTTDAPTTTKSTLSLLRFTKSTAWGLGFVFSMTATFLLGYTLGQQQQQQPPPPSHQPDPPLVLPNGLPRTCCSDNDSSSSNSANSKGTNPQVDENTDQDDIASKLAVFQERQAFLIRLRRIVGKHNVLVANDDNDNKNKVNTARFLKGARIVHDDPTSPNHTVVIVTPEHLHHVVNLVEAALQLNSSSSTQKIRCTFLPQGQNTGLTGGSTPRYPHQDPHHHHHITLLISFKNLNAIIPLDDGERVCCMAGVGLASLERYLHDHFPHRESHSILGSTFLNPTTAAGVAFGSGGTQCRKGPAYTERALYLKITENKWQEQQIELVNTLEIDGLNDSDLPAGHRRKQMDTIPYRVDTWGRWIQQGYEEDMKYTTPSVLDKMKQGRDKSYPLASDIHYGAKLCRRNSSSVSRYNADCSGPDCCRSEGKVIILATVHDTFPKPQSKKTFWISFDSMETAFLFRQQVALDNPKDLPISMEYMDRDAFDVIDDAGRVLGNLIKYIGTSSTLIRQLWNVKLYIEALPYAMAPLWVDQLLYRVNRYFPAILPKSIMEMGQKWDHHVMMTIGEFGNGTMDRMVERMNDFAKQHGSEKICIVECDRSSSSDNGSVPALSSITIGGQTTAAALNAFRFVAAPAFRTWCVGHHMQGYSVDYALPKNGGTIPALCRNGAEAGIVSASTASMHALNTSSIADAAPNRDVPVKRMRYSHFACNVVHEDLAYEANVDIKRAKHMLKDVIEFECSGKLPAEHGHGTEYVAPITTQERWKRIDPLNLFNPGIGGLPSGFRYKDDYR